MRRTDGLSEWTEFLVQKMESLISLFKDWTWLVIKRWMPSVLSLSYTWSCYFNQGESWKINWVGLNYYIIVITLFSKVPAASEEVRWCSWPQGFTIALPLEQDVLMSCQKRVGGTAWGSLCCVYPLFIWDKEKLLDSRSAHLAFVL